VGLRLSPRRACMDFGGDEMASVALEHPWGLFTLTDRRNDITTTRPQSSSVGLTLADLVRTPSTIELVVESRNGSRCLRFAVRTRQIPPWLKPAAGRAGKLLLLPHGWDRQGALPIDSSSIQSAMESLSSIMSSNSSVPQWTPTQRSGVQLDWHENGVDVEIAFEPGAVDGHVVYSDQRQPDSEWEGPLGEHLPELRTLLRERLTSTPDV
jgi:hypothetical protein